MDFGFVGPSYEAPSIYQDAQECINWFPEVDILKQPGDRGVVALYPTPGLIVKSILPNQQEVRGMRTLSGGSQMVIVCGAYVYVMSSDLSQRIVGTLNTEEGIVSITDNGVNAYIVDGTYRYTWRIGNPSVANFVGSVSGTTLTVTRMTNGTIAVGQTLVGFGVNPETVITALGSGTGGVGTYTLDVASTVASSNLSTLTVGCKFTGSISGTTLTEVLPATSGSLALGMTIQGAGVTSGTIIIQDLGLVAGNQTWKLNHSMTVSSESMYGLDFTVLPSTDGPFQGGTTADIVDNYFVYSRKDSQQWGSSDLLSPISQGLSFGSKDGAPDNLVALIVDHREVYLMGEISSEVWTDVGAIPFPFQRIPGTSTQHGIGAKNSLARLGNSFAYLSRNNRGLAQIMQMNGYMPTRISTHAVENSLANQYVADAVAWTYQLEGHEVYVISFPTLQLTWAYDATTNMWHKWLYTTNENQFERHRGNCAAVFQGMVLVGDHSNGSIYQLDKNTYTDAGQKVRRVRRAPHLVADLQRQYFEELQIQFQPGVGTTGFSNMGPGFQVADPLTIYPNSNFVIGANDIYIITTQGILSNTTTTTYPQAMLRWSNDGGSTWSREYWCTVGQQGKYKNRAIWRRLGQARDRIFEVSVTDPVKMVIVSANLKASGADN